MGIDFYKVKARGLMMSRSALKKFFGYAGFIFAMMLAIIPISEAFMWLKPNFVVLLLIYWVVKAPKVVGIYFAFLLGIFIDLLMYRTLGITSLALCVVAYLTNLLRAKLSTFCLWQQALTIFLLIGFFQLILVWNYLFEGMAAFNIYFWLTIIANLIFWPILYFFMHNYQRFFNIS